MLPLHRVELWCPECGQELGMPDEIRHGTPPMRQHRHKAFTVACSCGHLSTGVFLV